MSKRRSIISLICIVVVIAALGLLAINGLEIGRYDLLPVSQAISQGLDLRGGAYALYDAKSEGVEDFDTKLSSTMDVIRRRLDDQGYTEATISQQGSSFIRVEIPDVSDPEEVLSIIGTPAVLQFVDPDGNVILEGDDVVSAEPAIISENGNEPVVSFELNEEGTAAFATATSEHIGEIIRITLDGEDISTPTVETAITGGKGYIDGMESYDSAKELASLIESGALPLELEQIEVRSISATLGADALSRSLMAGAVGLVILMVFMICYYRLLGALADIALMLYLEIVVYLLAIIPSIQLTLPGIAGIILSLGMAVDANVIIFERFKEELRAGRSMNAAQEAGYKKAFITIFDSNVTTLLAAFVLMWVGTGSIKGFAITLTIGVLVSMFTALTITRLLQRSALGLNITKPSLYMPVRKEAKTDEV